MKHLTQYINEGIFDDNVKKPPIIHDVEIDTAVWHSCVEYFEKTRKKYFTGNRSTVDPFNKEEYEILYSQKDCAICSCLDGPDKWIMVLSPETIYMNYMSLVLTGDDKFFKKSSNNRIDDPGNLGKLGESPLIFAFPLRIRDSIPSFKQWNELVVPSLRPYYIPELLKMNFPTKGYMPETISKKAQKIIEEQ